MSPRIISIIIPTHQVAKVPTILAPNLGLSNLISGFVTIPILSPNPHFLSLN